MLLFLIFIRPFTQRSILISEILNEVVIFSALLAVSISHYFKRADLFYLFCGFIGTIMTWSFGSDLVKAIKKLLARKDSFIV